MRPELVAEVRASYVLPAPLPATAAAVIGGAALAEGGMEGGVHHILPPIVVSCFARIYCPAAGLQWSGQPLGGCAAVSPARQNCIATMRHPPVLRNWVPNTATARPLPGSSVQAQLRINDEQRERILAHWRTYQRRVAVARRQSREAIQRLQQQEADRQQTGIPGPSGSLAGSAGVRFALCGRVEVARLVGMHVCCVPVALLCKALSAAS